MDGREPSTTPTRVPWTLVKRGSSPGEACGAGRGTQGAARRTGGAPTPKPSSMISSSRACQGQGEPQHGPSQPSLL